MNVLFLSLSRIESIDQRSIYMDLLKEFAKNGHNVYAVSPAERRTGKPSGFVDNGGIRNFQIYNVKIGNITKTNLVEKAISTVLIGRWFKKAIKKQFAGIKFDLVLYATPPITFEKVIRFVKQRDGAKSYLMLKDIFPQNAVDLGMMKKTGIKSVVYKYFRRKEKRLYALSDVIGCMSPANVNYVLKHNPSVNSATVQLCPNSVQVQDMRLTAGEKQQVRARYGLPADKRIFVYGGNLGKPQGIPFIIECLKLLQSQTDAFFLIAGSGTEFKKLEAFAEGACSPSLRLMPQLPKEEYDRMVAACDVGLLFLDNRFTIPNFPSRLLSYMQAGLPVLACTDANTDVGQVIRNGGFGWWCQSNNAAQFNGLVKSILQQDIAEMGDRAMAFLQENYTVEDTYKKIAAAIGVPTD